MEVNLHHIVSHPFRCFHSEIHAAITVHGDSQLERDVAVHRTETECIWEKVELYTGLHPSNMDNSRH